MKDIRGKRIIASIFIFLISFFLRWNIAQAKKTIEDAGAALESAVTPTGLPKNEVATYIGSVAQWLFGILGLLFFVLTLYAGITWFLARGEEEKIAKSRQTLIAATIGLIITVSGYAITSFITNAINFG
ncbi:MAG TPA: hypothetical protein PK295_02350 [Candidatus Magasanikbacteria bacterium]|nr:hypothetical protein [Candidatus Magasanikbacteria bacterium]